MAKCGGCGQFVGRSDCTRCSRCPGSYHPNCIGLTTTKVSANWLCPECKAKMPKKDNSSTPVKGPSDGNTDVNSQLSPKLQRAVVQNTAVTEKITTPPNLPSKSGSQELNVAYEIRCFREELSAMRADLRQFRDDIVNLKTDIGYCRERMDVIEDRVCNLEKRFEKEDPSSSVHIEETVAELRLQLNERDQDLLLNDIILSGIPEAKDETPLHLIQLVSSKLGVNIDERDIVNAERIGMVRRNFTSNSSGDTVGRPRALAVRLSRRATRDQLLRAARVRRGLTTCWPARHKFKYVWTKEGRIYAKKEDGVFPQRIRSDLDIARIFGNGQV
ncbi:hypothetical protein ACJJTC_009749 [Scirpophaga incertulas]